MEQYIEAQLARRHR